MKAYINIYGGIYGNHKLANACNSLEALEMKNTCNGILITFSSLKDAYKALWHGYKSLLDEEPEAKDRLAGIRYVKKRAIYHDASIAEIYIFK